MIRIDAVRTLLDRQGGWILDDLKMLRLVHDAPPLDEMSFGALRDFLEEHCHVRPGEYTIAHLNGSPRNRIVVAETAGKPIFVLEEVLP
jgi:hypothetical protein